jgi:transcriptional regulator with XRE-family HTH domain
VNATLRLRHDELAKHRASAALHTEQGLADAMGADRGTVNRVLRGKSKPGVDFAASLVAALANVSFTDVWEIVTTGSGESL